MKTITTIKPLTRVWAVLLAFLLVATYAVTATQPAHAATGPYNGYTLSQAQKIILDKTNAARKKAGLKPVKLNAEMNTMSTNWSKAQASKNRMSHNPNYAKQTPSGWFTVAENVAYGYKVNDVVNAWMNSAGHRANILNKNMTHMGVGLAKSKSGLIFYTQNFGAYHYYKNTVATQLKSKASKSSSTLVTIPKSSVHVYRGQSGAYIKVVYKGKTGWVLASHMKRV